MAGVYDFLTKIEDLDKLVKSVGARETHALRYFMGSDKVMNNQFDWVNKSLRSFKSSLAAALASTTATVLTLSSGTTTGRLRIVDGKTHIEIADERMLVNTTITVTTNTTVIGVTRAVTVGSTAGVTASTANTGINAEVDVLDIGQVDGFAFDRDDSELGVKVTNYTQIFDFQVTMTGTAQAIKTVGDEQSLIGQLKDGSREVMSKLEKALFFGVPDPGAAGTVRRTAGLRHYATQAGNVTDAAGAALSFAHIENVITTMINRGADPSKIMMLVSTTQQRKFNELKPARINGGGQNQSDQSINNFIETYDWGGKALVKVQYNLSQKNNEVYFCQEDYIKTVCLRKFEAQQIAKIADADRSMIVGEYGFKVMQPRETLYRISNLSIS